MLESLVPMPRNQVMLTGWRVTSCGRRRISPWPHSSGSIGGGAGGAASGAAAALAGLDADHASGAPATQRKPGVDWIPLRCTLETRLREWHSWREAQINRQNL